MKTTPHDLPGLPRILERSVGRGLPLFRFADVRGVGGVYLATGVGGNLKITGTPHYRAQEMRALGATWDRVHLAWWLPVTPRNLVAIVDFCQAYAVGMDAAAVALLAAAAGCSCQDVLSDLASAATGRDREAVTQIAETLR